MTLPCSIECKLPPVKGWDKVWVTWNKLWMGNANGRQCMIFIYSRRSAHANLPCSTDKNASILFHSTKGPYPGMILNSSLSHPTSDLLSINPVGSIFKMYPERRKTWEFHSRREIRKRKKPNINVYRKSIKTYTWILNNEYRRAAPSREEAEECQEGIQSVSFLSAMNFFFNIGCNYSVKKNDKQT